MHGRVIEEDGRPVPDTLVEIWQCNAAGRYLHARRPAPGAAGPELHRPGAHDHRRRRRVPLHHDQAGRVPVGQPPQRVAARPTSTSRCSGRAFTQRLVTQMYFPGDPLFFQDPIFNSVRDEKARALMISAFDLDATSPEWALAYKWDIVLRADAVRGPPLMAGTTRRRPSGPFFSIGLPWPDGPTVVEPGHRGRDHAAPATCSTAKARRCPTRMVETWQAGPDGTFDSGFRGFGRAPTDADGRWEITTLKPGRVGRRARRRTSTSRCSRAGCSTASSPASTSPTRRRPTPPTRCCPADRRSAGDADRRARRRRLPLRHPPPGSR